MSEIRFPRLFVSRPLASRMVQALLVTVMALSMFLASSAGVDRAFALDPADCTYYDSCSLVDVLAYWQSEPVDSMFAIESILVRWEDEGDMTAEDVMVTLYEEYPQVVIAYWGYASIIHPELIAHESGLASATVQIGSVPAQIVALLLDTNDFMQKLASAEGEKVIEITGAVSNVDDLTNTSEGWYVCGDANRNGIISMQDVTYIELIILEFRDETELADANRNGKINMQDVTQVELLILGTARTVYLYDID